VAVLALAAPLPGFAQHDAIAQAAFLRPGLEKARLDIQTGKQRYVPGELVMLQVRVINPFKTSIYLDEGAGVRSGQLKVYIARGDGPFREYIGPQWGTLDVAHSGEVEVAPGWAHELEVTLLYNQPPETKHLSGLYAKQMAARRVEAAYALGEPGTYRIKAVLYDADFSLKIESEPVQVKVEEPRGADRTVWSELKTNPEYGYFIQTGNPRGNPTSAHSRALVESLEKLAEAHPDSRHAERIRSSLAHHRQTLEKLKSKKLIDE
jgi:hypothetical protein